MRSGRYAGFDEEQPTSEQDGKAVVIERLKSTNSYRNVVMVGDGATDLAARPPAVSVSFAWIALTSFCLVPFALN
jgi:soluble P-type ATPase